MSNSHYQKGEVLYTSALNLLSHGKYYPYDPKEMTPHIKELFKNIRKAVLDRYKFSLYEFLPNETKDVN